MLFYGDEVATTNSVKALAGQKQELHYDKYDGIGRIDAVTSFDFKTEMHYAGDNLIGYNYVIDVKGQILDFDVKKKYGQNFADKLKRMQRITKLLNDQGKALVYADQEHNVLLTARGCQLRSLSFDEQAGWTNGIPYSFQMTASEINFFQGELGPAGIIKNTYNKLVEGEQNKIKDFTDNISYTFDEGILGDIYTLDPEVPADPLADADRIEQLTVNFSYDISAVGMNYTNSAGLLIPAWEQARIFCQKKLKEKIEDMSNSVNARILSIDKTSSECNATRALNTLYNDNGPTSNAIFDNAGMVFKAYNEEITTTTSESEGSFGVKYSCILKRGTKKYIHKISKNLEQGLTDSSKKYKLQGTVEGLVSGGLFFGDDYGDIKFPNTGHFLVGNSTTASTVNVKFDNANVGYLGIVDQYECDLNDAAKKQLEITHAKLTNPDNDTIFCGGFLEAYPRASSFTVQKNWNEGTIDWTAEFSSSLDCAKDYTSIEFSINRETPVVTSLVIPNGSTFTPMNPLGIGHRLVYIGTMTNPTMDVTIKGTDHSQRYCCLGVGAGASLANFLTNSNAPITVLPSIYSKLPNLANAVLTRSSKTLNINTGDYTINLSYILCTPGCYITQGL